MNEAKNNMAEKPKGSMQIRITVRLPFKPNRCTKFFRTSFRAQRAILVSSPPHGPWNYPASTGV